MPFLTSVFFGFVPMFIFAYLLYWSDRYEKEPKVLLGAVFFWGALIAAGGAFIINTVLGLGVYFFTGSEAATDLTTGSVIAPIVEESLKGLAVLIVFLLFRREFDSVLDGIVYAGIVALGFAATENTYYIYTYGFQENGWGGLWFLVFVRVVLVGWQHPFYTAFTGIGLAVARLSRSVFVKFIAPLLGFGLAIFTHSVHNTLASFLKGLSGLAVGTFIDWGGWFFMFIFLVWAVARERKLLKQHLREEVSLGLMTAGQYRTATSAWAQSFARLTAIFNGRYRATQRFYQVCGELAHKKQQFATLGDEQGNAAIIRKLRTELGQLAPGAQA
ncbi:MAG: PrsW family intramembrane metalloprotease [Chloroflexi bacterium]|nr:PrsW family intramembrane metalloprotease [Chloroflexota bacterium]